MLLLPRKPYLTFLTGSEQSLQLLRQLSMAIPTQLPLGALQLTFHPVWTVTESIHHNPSLGPGLPALHWIMITLYVTVDSDPSDRLDLFVDALDSESSTGVKQTSTILKLPTKLLQAILDHKTTRKC